ncbi:MAG: hypothetical protein FWC50_11630 [Planctomycetaceae bacterium]|nr:hypothetical protein [Planctomycetaceae bacterium]
MMLKRIFVIPLMALVSYLTGNATQAQSDVHPEYYGFRLRSLNDGFMMRMPSSPDAWQVRREEVRRRILVANGLWPMPAKTPLHPVVEPAVERDAYNVYRVTLESFPGFCVTGNLYVPKKDGHEVTEKVPGILYVHGHWQDARFYGHDDERLKQELESGGESFDPSGRFPHQAFCVNMARLGTVVFFYDMVGHADSIQIPHMPGNREPSNISTSWGYCSPKAERHLQNVMGLQTYNSIRVLDWFETLKWVDAKRIGMTGASGGGTQTMMLSAVDDRIAVSCPAVMVSTGMQGGCTCENAPYLRIGAGNIDFAAVFAPKPLAMTTADDWTKEMPVKGFPDLKTLYEMLAVPENVALFEFPHFPHNYNQRSREAVYGWFNTHLRLNAETDENGHIREVPFEPLTTEQLTVWTNTHPKTDHVGKSFETSLLDWQTNDTNEQLQKLIPHDKATLAEFRRIVGGAMQTIVDPQQTRSETEQVSTTNRNFDFKSAPGPNDHAVHVVFLVTGAHLAADPATINNGEQENNANENPAQENSVEKRAAEWEAALMQSPAAVAIREKLPECVLVPVALAGQTLQHRMTHSPLVTKDEGNDVRPVYQYLYTFGYNDPVFVLRTRQIIAAVENVRKQAKESHAEIQVTLVGIDGAGKWAALAASQIPGQIDHLVLDTNGFRFENLDAVDDPDFLPGGAKYFDLPGMIALCAPTRLLLFGEAKLPEVVSAMYKSENAADRITCESENPDPTEKINAILHWLHDESVQ